MPKKEKPDRNAVIDPNKYTLSEWLAIEADRSKGSIIMGILKAATEGDRSAIQMIKEALDEATPDSDKNKPIPILMGITQHHAVTSDNSVKQDISAPKAA